MKEFIFCWLQSKAPWLSGLDVLCQLLFCSGGLYSLFFPLFPLFYSFRGSMLADQDLPAIEVVSVLCVGASC